MPCRAPAWRACRPASSSWRAQGRTGQEPSRAGRRQGEKRSAGVRGGGAAPEADRHRRAHPATGTRADRRWRRRSPSFRRRMRRWPAGFARDRISVTRLLAILERLQHDMPPALAVRPDDALAAARGAMLVGASLPPVYAKAAALARRIEKLKATRAALVARRAEAVHERRRAGQGACRSGNAVGAEGSRGGGRRRSLWRPGGPAGPGGAPGRRFRRPWSAG